MKIYLLEEVFFDSVDLEDGEKKEIRLSDGLWANHRKFLFAKKRILEELTAGWTLEETEFDVPIRKNQKYLYVLNYEYFTNDGTCFYYQFEPCTSAKKCWLMKEEKAKEDKYKLDSSKIIRRGADGWFIERYEIVY